MGSFRRISRLVLPGELGRGGFVSSIRRFLIAGGFDRGGFVLCNFALSIPGGGDLGGFVSRNFTTPYSPVAATSVGPFWRVLRFRTNGGLTRSVGRVEVSYPPEPRGLCRTELIPSPLGRRSLVPVRAPRSL